MKSFILALACMISLSTSGFSQQLNYDGDDDGCITVNDVIGLLSEFGQCEDEIGCPEEFIINGICYDSYFIGLDVEDDLLEQYIVNIDRYIENLSGLLYELRNPLWSINNNGEWSIYFHIESWGGPVTDNAIVNLINQYESIANYWLEGLTDFDSEAPDNATIKVFGFVFNEGVEVDDSFYNTFGNYPIVINWQETTESAPWHIVQIDNSEFGSSQADFPWYTFIDLDNLKVIGNRTDLNSNVILSPSDWDDYAHPENIDQFYTKFWHKTTWDAVAQRQYLKIGGVITDYATGQAGFTTLDPVFTHEMGHCFFHDDLYDIVKYPDAVGLESVMNGHPEISNFDRIIQRIVWEAQKNQ